MWFGAAGIALSTTAAVTVGTIMDALLVRRFFRGEVRTTPHYALVSETFRTLVAVIPVVGVALLARSWIGAAHGFSGVALHIDGWRVLLGRIRRRAPLGSAGNCSPKW
jgi:hypothetical protein